MKKFAVVLLSALLAISITACGGSQETESSVSSQVSAESTVSNTENASKEENSIDNSSLFSNEEQSSNTSESSSVTSNQTSENSVLESSDQTSSDSSSQTSGGSSSGTSGQTSGGSSSGSSGQTSGGLSSGSSGQTSGNSSSGSSGQTSGGSSSGSSGQTSGGSSSGSSGQTSGNSSSGSSGQTSGSSTPNVDPSKIGPLMQKYYLDIMSDGKFYMDATINGASNGQTLKNTPMVVAVDNGNKIYTSTKVSGISIVILSDGKSSYMLYPMTKTAIKISDVEDDNVVNDFTTDDLTLTNTGSETFNGQKCQYESYYSDGVTSTFYFYNNTLAGIVMQSDEMDKTSSDYTNLVIIVNELTNEVDDSLFTVPSDYKITDSSASSLLT